MKTIYIVLLVLTMAGSAHAHLSNEMLSQNDAVSQNSAVQGSENSQPSSVKGILLEKGTRRALADITLYVRDDKSKEVVETLTTDKKGNFQCRLAPGEYSVIVAAVGYDKYEEKLMVGEKEIPELTLRLVPLTINPYQIIVRRKEKSSEVSDQQLSIQEATQIAGNNRDVLSSVKNLPGVSSISIFNGYGSGIVIRGSSQEDSLFQVNGHEAYDLYHFGGLESIIEPELIESVEYIAGGFSAEYGNAMGGVIDLEIKDPRTDRLGGFANVSLLSTSFMLEGPISEKDSFAVSFKRGFLGEYLKMAQDMDDDGGDDYEFTQYPYYYDSSFIYRHAFSKGNDVKLTGVGKWNAIEIDVDYDSVAERDSNQAQVDDDFYSLVAEWDYDQDAFRSLFSPTYTYSYINQYYGDRAYHKQTFNIYELSEKIEYRAGDSHLVKGGADLILADANIDSYSYAVPKEGEVDSSIYDQEMRLTKDFFLYYPSLYVMDQIELGRFSVTPGIRYMYDSHNEHGAVDPRLSAKYQLTTSTALKGATGLYSQRPQYDECVEPWGTKGLKPEKSIHGVLGVEHQLSENINLDVQTYYKDFYDLVSRESDTTDASAFTNDGTGYSYGAEILLRHQMTDHFFGWISYAYSVTRRKDGPGEEERYFDYDIPHNFIAVASYKPNRYWSFGLKYQYRSGQPYTDLLNTETLYDVDKDQYYPIYTDSINEDRYKAYQSLDFRIDKYWIFNNFILSTYIDWRNILQTKNVLVKYYNEDYTQSDDFLDISSQVPMIFLGVKLDF